MKLIADSGSTKTDWAIFDGGNIAGRLRTQGINPVMQSGEAIDGIIAGELLAAIADPGAVDTIRFYGAGCREGTIPKMRRALSRAFPLATDIEVSNDLLAAARALFGKGEGIACILGTGSNSCLYDGRAIVGNVPPLGYILGDEGSGAVLGRLLVGALYKGGLDGSVRELFERETGLDVSGIIRNVYGEPMGNRFLASLSRFVGAHIDDAGLRELAKENFRAFFRRNVDAYGRRDLRVGAVGGMAHHYRGLFLEVARERGYGVAKVMESPMEGLICWESAR